MRSITLSGQVGKLKMIRMFERAGNIKHHDWYRWEGGLCGYLVPHVVIAGEYPCLGDLTLNGSGSVS